MTGLNAGISDGLLGFEFNGCEIFHPSSCGVVVAFFGSGHGCFIEFAVTTGFDDVNLLGFTFGRNNDGEFDGIFGGGGLFYRIVVLRGRRQGKGKQQSENDGADGHKFLLCLLGNITNNENDP